LSGREPGLVVAPAPASSMVLMICACSCRESLSWLRRSPIWSYTEPCGCAGCGRLVTGERPPSSPGCVRRVVGTGFICMPSSTPESPGRPRGLGAESICAPRLLLICRFDRRMSVSLCVLSPKMADASADWKWAAWLTAGSMFAARSIVGEPRGGGGGGDAAREGSEDEEESGIEI